MKEARLVWILVIFLIPFAVGCSNGGGTPSPSLEIWHWRNPLPQGNDLSAVAYGSNLFVAVGDNGAIITSPDGVSWTAQSSGTNNRLNGIAYGNGIYVAVGEYGRILTSPAGVTWTDRSTLQPFLPSLTEVTFGNGIFIASGILASNIYSYTSYDGVTWTNGPSGIHAVTYANGMFMAVQTFYSLHGYIPPSQTIVTSPDGLTWTPISTPNWPYDISQLAYGNGLWVGTGVESPIVTSSDGVIWTEATSAVLRYSLPGFTYGNGFFVAVGDNCMILISADGKTWQNRDQACSSRLAGVTYGKGIFVAVGSNGAILQSDPLQDPMRK